MTHFSVEVTVQFEKIYHKKKSPIFTKIFWIIQNFHEQFSMQKSVLKFSIYLLTKLLTTWLTQIIYCWLKQQGCLNVSILIIFNALFFLGFFIFYYSLYLFFTGFTWFKSITPNNKLSKKRISRIIFIKIITIKVNIIKLYRIKANTITKSCIYIWGYIIKVYIISGEYKVIDFFKHLTHN